MKILEKIVLSLIAIPFAIVGGLIVAIIKIIQMPLDLFIKVICDIWERDYNE